MPQRRDARHPVHAEGVRFATSQTDALLIVTEWKEFRSPDFDVIKTTLNQPVIIDGRNLYDPKLGRMMGVK